MFFFCYFFFSFFFFFFQAEDGIRDFCLSRGLGDVYKRQSISLFKLLEDEAYDIDGLTTDIKLEDLFFAVCRGGWPRCMALSKDSAKLEIAKDYYRQIYQKDISAIDGVNRNPEWARTLLWSYARNMATTAKRKNIFSDVKATQNVTDVTLSSYIDALELLYVCLLYTSDAADE